LDAGNQEQSLLGNIKELKDGEPLLPRLLGMLVKERQNVKGRIKTLG
jgi:hypothetical protein